MAMSLKGFRYLHSAVLHLYAMVTRCRFGSPSKDEGVTAQGIRPYKTYFEPQPGVIRATGEPAILKFWGSRRWQRHVASI